MLKNICLTCYHVHSKREGEARLCYLLNVVVNIQLDFSYFPCIPEIDRIKIPDTFFKDGRQTPGLMYFKLTNYIQNLMRKLNKYN